ncbi:MAG: hypothetical protein JST30_08070 [Armatimonadetes bacterium]|nr:hypothetical protein [Armatimonadota bacterium]
MKRTALLSLLLLGPVAHAVRYRCIDLGGPGGPWGSTAWALNDSNMVVGATHSISELMVWTEQTGMFKPGPSPFAWTPGLCMDVNSSSTVVGYTDLMRAGKRMWQVPFVWKPGQGLRLLDLVGRTQGLAFAVNDVGVACGYVFTSPEDACVWDASGKATLIGRLHPDWGSTARDINGSGIVCGSARLGTGASRAFRWKAGEGMTDLGVLFGDTESRAFGVNGLGYIVGYSSNVSTGSQGFIVPPGGQMQPYGVFHTELEDINDSLQAVGVLFADPARACLVEPGMGTIDLNTVTEDIPAGWRLDRARSINSRGDIVGVAALGSDTRAFLLIRLD